MYTVDVKYTFYPNISEAPYGGISHVQGAWTFEFVTQNEDEVAEGAAPAVLAYKEGVRPDIKTGQPPAELLNLHVGYNETFMGVTPAGESYGIEDFATSGILIFDTNGKLQGWNTYDSTPPDDPATTNVVEGAGFGDLSDPENVQAAVNAMNLRYNYQTGEVYSAGEGFGEEPDGTPIDDFWEPVDDEGNLSQAARDALKYSLKKGFQIPLQVSPQSILDPPSTFGADPPSDLGVMINKTRNLNGILSAGGYTVDRNYVEGTAPNLTYDGGIYSTDFNDVPSYTLGEDDADNDIFGFEINDQGVTNDLYTKMGTIMMNVQELYQFGGQNTKLEMIRADGNRPGTLDDLSIDGNGKITGRYSNGETRLLGQIAVAKFINPAGLEKMGNSLFAATTNSGPWNGVGDVGDIISGALEMSNVDLSQEFTEMITTQRGFQANSRTITVSDEMLQELVNLKR
jgi:flagellar hook protein FlgE